MSTIPSSPAKATAAPGCHQAPKMRPGTRRSPTLSRWLTPWAMTAHPAASHSASADGQARDRPLPRCADCGSGICLRAVWPVLSPMATVEDYGRGFMKAVITLVVVAAALLTGFTIPIALAAHTSSAGAPATCKPHGHRHHRHVLCRSSSPSPATATTGSSPSAKDTSSPTPTATSSSPSPSPASTSSSPSPGGTACVIPDPSGNCGPYDYAGITNSNGFNTYVGNNCWADPSCQQIVTAHDPGNWSLSARRTGGEHRREDLPGRPAADEQLLR